jgi:hypothetical protein
MGRCRRQVILHPTKRRRRTVKSCGPGAATLALPAGGLLPHYGGKRGRSPGRARNKPSNHCAGKAGMSWLYLSNPCAFLLPHCTRCCGCRRRPAFSAPSSRREQTKSQSSGENRAVRTKAHVPPQIHPSSRASEARPGTHNHREQFCEGWSSSAPQQLNPVVMGPGVRRDDIGFSLQHCPSHASAATKSRSSSSPSRRSPRCP